MLRGIRQVALLVYVQTLSGSRAQLPPRNREESSCNCCYSFSTYPGTTLVVSCFSLDRQKFKRKKARHTEKERQRRDRQHTSKTRRSSSQSRTIPGTETDKRDRGESRRAEDDARSPKREERRSSRTHANREEDNHRRSKARGSDSSRHKRNDKLESDRTRGDGDESSKHRSSRRRRDDESRKGGETRSSSRGHRKTSDRRKDDGGSTRAQGSEAGHGHRGSKRSQRREERDRDEDGSSRRHRSRGHDETRRRSTHGGRGGSDPAQSPKEGEKRSTSVATDDDSEAGVDGWVSVSPGRKASSSSRGQTRGKTVTPKSKGKPDEDAAGEYSSEGEEDTPQHSKHDERNGRGRTTEEYPSEDLTSAQERIDIAPSRRDSEGREGETHTTPTKIETVKNVEKPMDDTGKRGLVASSGRLDNVRGQRENTRSTVDTGRGPERSVAVEVSTRSWNDNDLEVSWRGIYSRDTL